MPPASHGTDDSADDSLATTVTDKSPSFLRWCINGSLERSFKIRDDDVGDGR